MNYRQREHATKIVKLQAETVSELEALLETIGSNESEIARNQIIKMQADLVHWQNRFNRLVYLTGEVTGE